MKKQTALLLVAILLTIFVGGGTGSLSESLQTDPPTAQNEMEETDMADATEFNVGGTNFNIKDEKSRYPLSIGGLYPANLFNQTSDLTKNGYVNWNTGAINADADCVTSDYIAVSTSYYYHFEHILSIAFYSSDKSFISGLFLRNEATSMVPPSGSAYVRVSFNKNTWPIDNVLVCQGQTPPFVNIAGLDLNYLQDVSKGLSLYDDNLHSVYNLSFGFYVNWTTGNLTPDSDHVFVCSDYVEVEPNTEYYQYNIIHHAWYDSSKTLISGMGNTPQSITSPLNAKYIRYDWLSRKSVADVFLGSQAAFNDAMAFRDPSNIDNRDVTVMLANKYPVGRFNLKQASMTSGNVMQTAIHNIAKNCVYKFMCRVTSLTELRIGHGETVYEGSYLKLTATNADIVNYYSSDNIVTQTHVHGLTISDYLEITLTTGPQKVSVAITSNGSTYTITDDFWEGDGYATSFVKLVTGSLTDCDFSWSCKDLNRAVYMFGDSYFGTGTDKRWCYYLVRDGYIDNVLLNAYGGESSGIAYIAFENIINNYGVPKYAVWCMGMNDGSDDGEPRSTWLSTVQSFISKCNSLGITPILATIPSVPSINHEYKNAWVRNSGYRYIDFAKAVGSDLSTSWYPGMLSSDNVHPDTLGALTLYNQAITDVPEITFGW